MKLRRWLFGAVLPLALRAADFDAASATNEVGLDLFRQLARAQANTNLVISPYSIESALALAYAGADGTTRTEMGRALRLSDDAQVVERGFAGLRTALETAAAKGSTLSHALSRQGPKTYAILNGQRTELVEEPLPAIEWHAANRLYAQQGYPIRAEFRDRMADGYGAPLQTLDFRTDADGARQTINDWVSGQTREKIRNLIPAGGIQPRTRLVLVNALYLKAAWAKPFVPQATRPEPFHFANGDTRNVPTMQREGALRYAHESALTVLALEYVGDDLQCVLLLPDAGRSVEDVVAKLTVDDFARWAKIVNQRGQKVWLHLPKFRVDGATLPLGRELRSLGMSSAFDVPPRSANFDRIAPRTPADYFFISEVFHRTFVLLDEEGTEAAAATAVMAVAGAMADPNKPIEVRFDRPFLFAIQHRGSGLCLFLGRITDPR